MTVERTTPQLVKKGKGKKRPGYRGPGGYQGRGGYGASRSSNTSNQGGNRPNPHTASGTSKTTTVSGDRMRSSARETQQAINNARAIEDAKKAKRKETLKNTTRFGYQKPKSNFRGILGTIAGMLMGIPGLGLLTGGLGKIGEGLGSLNDKIQSTDFAKSTSLMDYLDAKKYGGIDARDRAASKNMREARAIQTQMGLRPSSTMSFRDYAMAGLQTPQTFSDPFANTVGTTTKVNAPSNDAVSSVTRDYSGIQDYGVDINPQGSKSIFERLANLNLSNPFISSAAAAEISPAIGIKDSLVGPVPTGDVGLNASGRLGNLTATINAIDALKGESVNPQFNYGGNFGNTNVFGNFSDDAQNIGLNFNNNKGLSGGISYDAITGEPRFDIGFRRTFEPGGGLSSLFTRR